MLYLLAYDIASDRRRKRVSDMLEELGERIQLSVFLIDGHRIEPESLLIRVATLIDPRVDRADLFPLCQRCERTALGVGRPLVE